MNKILNIPWSQAALLPMLAALVAFCCFSMPLNAEILWPQPLSLFSARNAVYYGHAVPSPDGSYALLWSIINPDGDRQICFQRFSFNDQPLNPQPVIITGTQGKVPWRIIRASNGNYFVLARGTSQSLLLLIDPDGMLLNTAATMAFNISAQSRVDLVPDLSGGAWLGLQISLGSSLRRVNHYNSVGQAAIPGFLEIPDTNNVYSHLNILVQPDNSVICAYNHLSNARIVKISSDVQISQDTMFSYSSDPMVDCKVFQDGAGNLIWVGRMNAFLYSKNIQAMKTTDQGTLLWSQPLSFSNPGGAVKSWDAVALGDDSYAFGLITQSPSGSPNLTYFGQRFNSSGNTFYGYYNQQRALEPLDAEATVQLKLVPSASAGTWALIRKYDPNDWIFELSCLYMSPNGINWAGEQILHSEPLHSNFGEIGFGGYAHGSNLMAFAQVHASSQSNILKNSVSSTGSVQEGQILASTETAIIWDYVQSSLGSSVFCAWITDVEPYLWPQKKELIRYQLVNSQGQKLLPQDGQILSGGVTKDIEKPKSLSLPDDTVLLWWVEHDSDYRLRAQLIDAAGNQLWDEGGRLILTDPALQSNQALASFYGGDIYFVWDMESANEIRGQRLVNGIPQWESQGRLLIDANSALYPDIAGISLLALEGNSLFYGCGTTYDSAYGYPTCITMWRFDPSGQGLTGFGPSGVQVLRYYDNLSHSLEFRGVIPTPQGFLVQAYAWEGYWDFWGYLAYTTGIMQQFVDLDGMWAWGHEGQLNTYPCLIIGADADSYYSLEIPQIVKRDMERNLLWSEHLGYSSTKLAETQPGIFIGIADHRNYYSFTSQGDLYWPTQSQFTSVIDADAKLTAMGGDAYILYRQKTTSYAFYDYNSSPLRLQRFNRSATQTDDPQIPALSELIALSSSPNPFRESVSLQLSCKQPIHADISVYNLRGQKIRTLHQGDLPQGASLIPWDGKDSSGRETASGIYFVRVQSPGHKSHLRKLMKL